MEHRRSGSAGVHSVWRRLGGKKRRRHLTPTHPPMTGRHAQHGSIRLCSGRAWRRSMQSCMASVDMVTAAAAEGLRLARGGRCPQARRDSPLLVVTRYTGWQCPNLSSSPCGRCSAGMLGYAAAHQTGVTLNAAAPRHARSGTGTRSPWSPEHHRHRSRPHRSCAQPTANATTSASDNNLRCRLRSHSHLRISMVSSPVDTHALVHRAGSPIPSPCGVPALAQQLQRR